MQSDTDAVIAARTRTKTSRPPFGDKGTGRFGASAARGGLQLRARVILHIFASDAQDGDRCDARPRPGTIKQDRHGWKEHLSLRELQVPREIRPGPEIFRGATLALAHRLLPRMEELLHPPGRRRQGRFEGEI